mmetsp:Transcript_94934/g.306489  ORF Transcript_94934/g.306489 Transcript_94934/m.306489 type:complete len:294 (+) Transcript_94934:412-1293(+)
MQPCMGTRLGLHLRLVDRAARRARRRQPAVDALAVKDVHARQGPHLRAGGHVLQADAALGAGRGLRQGAHGQTREQALRLGSALLSAAAAAAAAAVQLEQHVVVLGREVPVREQQLLPQLRAPRGRPRRRRPLEALHARGPLRKLRELHLGHGAVGVREQLAQEDVALGSPRPSRRGRQRGKRRGRAGRPGPDEAPDQPEAAQVHRVQLPLPQPLEEQARRLATDLLPTAAATDHRGARLHDVEPLATGGQTGGCCCKCGLPCDRRPLVELKCPRDLEVALRRLPHWSPRRWQ